MISVVIPIYNEEKAITETIEYVKQVCATMRLPFEIIVIDDGSTDSTPAILHSLEGITSIFHLHNIGYGRSLKDGICAARYDTIVITDADLTYPFDRVPDLYREYLKGFDMVVGARSGKNYTESVFKRPLRRILKLIVEFVAEREIPDVNSGLRIFNRNTAKTFFHHLCDGFSFTTSITLGYMMTGKFVAYVPVGYNKRSGRTKVKLYRDSLRTMQYILQAAMYYNPLKMFFSLAFLCVICAFSGFLMSALFHLRVGFLFGTGSLLVALFVLCLGFLADLLKQILSKGNI
ncbi:MAG: glycosyltransferase family 2 protein [Holosporales bacterium]|jgi:glycosyltransferase involved in cell wall biosynthesis|nr:glycosyltransferase family 2 protein [Holosporales bacterium]